MRKILLILSIFSLSFTGTMYMAYDFDETENITLGYNHTFKTWTCEESGKPCWILAGGANYDVVDNGLGFASIYALPMKLLKSLMDLNISIKLSLFFFPPSSSDK